MAASMSPASRLGIHSESPVTEEFEFLRCGLRKSRTHVISAGIRGTRSRFSNQANRGTYAVGGPIVFEPRPDDLDLLLPWITGGTKSGNTIAVAETVPERYVVVDKIARVVTYAGCKVNRAIFRGGTNRNLELELDVQGKTASNGNAGTFPNIATTLSELQPYIFQQGVLTLASTAYAFNDFTLTFDNALVLDKFENSETRVELPEGDRIITGSFNLGYSASEIALDEIAIAGIAGTLVFTNGNYSLTITLTNLKAPAADPEVPARPGEIRQTIDLQLFATDVGATITREIEFTNDSTA